MPLLLAPDSFVIARPDVCSMLTASAPFDEVACRHLLHRGRYSQADDRVDVKWCAQRGRPHQHGTQRRQRARIEDVTSTLCSVTVPALGRRSAAIVLSSVDLPALFGPISAISRPGGRSGRRRSGLPARVLTSTPRAAYIGVSAPAAGSGAAAMNGAPRPAVMTLIGTPAAPLVRVMNRS